MHSGDLNNPVPGAGFYSVKAIVMPGLKELGSAMAFLILKPDLFQILIIHIYIEDQQKGKCKN